MDFGQKPFYKIELKSKYMKNNDSPFVYVSKTYYDGEDTIRSFIRAVKNNDKEKAMRFMSKNMLMVSSVNFEELSNVFDPKSEFTSMDFIRFERMPSMIKANTVLCKKENEKLHSVINMFMVKEPDLYGSWKICGIERE